MTPREALAYLRANISITSCSAVTMGQAIITLEHLVSKDEAEATPSLLRPAAIAPVPNGPVGPSWPKEPATRSVCTCGTHTPCRIWGHS